MSMQLHISLSNKVLLLVTLPLLVQMGLLACLAAVQSEAEADLRSADYGRSVSDAINGITTTVYSIVSTYGTEETLTNISLSDAIYTKHLAGLRNQYKQLKDITANDPQLAALVVSSEQKAEKGLTILKTMKDSFNRSAEKERDLRKPMWHELRATVSGVLNSDLATAGQRARSLADHSPEVQARHRHDAQTLMLLIGTFNLLLTALAALYLTKGITSRLRTMNDNTYRLASGLPLNPVMRGTDEIARLDQVFHDLESSLKEVSRKEQALLNNARDLICSLDAQGRITAANPASKPLIGYQTRDLLGTYAVDLVLAEDKVKIMDYLDNAKIQNLEHPIEVQLQRANNSVVDTLWSVQWSAQEKSFFCIIHDISERRAAENMKQEVLAMVSHDLRTPLTTTMNAIDFLEMQSEGVNNERELRYIGMAKRSVGRMMALINDLLDVEKARAGMMSLDSKPTYLSECFRACEDLATGYADSANVHLEFQPTDLIVEVDEKLFVRVLQNLVSNAVKFSPVEATVKISATRAGETAHIIVEDAGPGIPASQVSKVFERFHQIDGQLAKAKGGTGLGLTICKVMTELHGGKIWVESEEGKGSKFQLTIPLASRPVLVQQTQASNAASG